MTGWIDTHAHLDWPDFADLAEVLRQARAAGVEHVVTVGTDRASSLKARSLAKRESGISAAFGVHPNEAGRATDEDWREVEALLREGDAIGVGETGLDFYRDRSPRDRQETLFRRHLALARELELPVIVHSRESFAPCLAAIREFPGVRGVFHCFSGGPEEAEEAQSASFYLSFAGNLAYPKSERLREAAASAPIDRLLVETDSPFLTPPPHRGKRNQPAFVAETGRALAAIRGLPEEEMAAVTSRNARALFGPRLKGGNDGA